MLTCVGRELKGEAGDNMGCLLRGIKREEVKRGQVIVIPNSIESVKRFKASLYVRLSLPSLFLSSHPLSSDGAAFLWRGELDL